MEIEDHYSQLLGAQVPWEISKVDLDMSAHRVDVEIEYTGVTGACPECGANCPRHDDRKPRSWRHLDTMQFATCLHCSVPRVRCQAHGARTVKVPWVGKNSRFTLLFEGFAVRGLQAARGIEEARKRLGLNWHQVNAIKARAVQRGLSRRQTVTMPYPGIDEKQFRKGHRYISSLVDLQPSRVLDGVEDRTEAACQALIEQSPPRQARGPLTPEQQQQVTGVAVDMWKAYRNAVEEKLPQADITSARSATRCMIGFTLANTSMRLLIKCVARRTKHSRKPEIGVWQAPGIPGWLTKRISMKPSRSSLVNLNRLT